MGGAMCDGGEVTVEPHCARCSDATLNGSTLATASLEDVAWYVVSIKMRREEFAASQLAQRAIEVFLPRIVLPRRGESVVRPLFPGYLFVHLALREQGARVTWTPGVRRLVMF